MNHEQILDKLIDDTMANKLHWYNNGDYLYCTMRVDKKGTIVDTIFRIGDRETVNEEDLFTSWNGEFLIVLDVYMRKNKQMNKEIFCFRIKDYQLKLTELLNAAMHVKKEKPKK